MNRMAVMGIGRKTAGCCTLSLANNSGYAPFGLIPLQKRQLPLCQKRFFDAETLFLSGCLNNIHTPFSACAANRAA
jgi:hypothetical protein